MNRNLAWKIIVALLLIAGSAVWLQAKQTAKRSVQSNLSVAMQVLTTPVVGKPTATPALIMVNTPTTVTVTVQIADPSLLPNGVNLLRLNSNGSSSILGAMHDDGLNGDETASDQIFSLNVNFNENMAGPIQLQVSAAFKGVLKRSLSTVVSIKCWNSIKNTSFDLNYPSTWHPDLTPSSTDAEPTLVLENLLGSLLVVLPQGGEPYDIDSDSVVNRVPLNLAGHPALRTTYSDSSGVYLTRIVFDPPLSANPDFRIDLRPAAGDLAGVTDYEQILQTLQIP